VSRHGKISTLTEGLATERNFDITLRGYHRQEVDRYVGLLEDQVAALTAERQETEHQLSTLGSQLHQVQMELLEVRRQPRIDGKITFRHLGPRAEQILLLAEEQAQAIKAEAVAEADAERERLEADRAHVRSLLEDAHRRCAKLLDDGTAELDSRRTDHLREVARLKDKAAEEISVNRAAVDELRAEAERVLGQAKQEGARIIRAAAADAERIRDEATAQAREFRVRAEEEATALASAAELYAQHTRTAADQHAQQTRLSAEQHALQTRTGAEQQAQQTRAAAEQTANEILVQAERYASQLRAGADQHVGAPGAVNVAAVPNRSTGADPERPTPTRPGEPAPTPHPAAAPAREATRASTHRESRTGTADPAKAARRTVSSSTGPDAASHPATAHAGTAARPVPPAGDAAAAPSPKQQSPEPTIADSSASGA
jgi:cell division septum initiation protein DivIVA